MLRDVGGWIKSKSSSKVCSAMRHASCTGTTCSPASPGTDPESRLTLDQLDPCYHASLFVSLPRHLINTTWG